jgi:hypothetical protein
MVQVNSRLAARTLPRHGSPPLIHAQTATPWIPARQGR